MGVIATFSYAAWAPAYPQFANVAQASIEGPVLALAQVYCRNDGGGPIFDLNTQTQALGLMVAHVAQLMFGSTTQPLSPLVGRIDSATQGSVSVHAEMPEQPNAAWFNQTQYGAAYWQLILPFRLGFYAPKISPLYNPIGSLPWYGAGW